MITTLKYVRKPLFVDAVLVTSDNFHEVATWCQGEVHLNEDNDSYIRVRVHNPKSPRQTKAFVGDWILYTERGYKVYTEKAFKYGFTPVPQNLPTVDQMLLSEMETVENAPINS